MAVQTTLAKEIEIAGEKARYDQAVKRVLAEKQILAWIMKNCMEEFKDIEIREIADKYIEGEPQVAAVPVMPDETNAVFRVNGTGVEDVTLNEGTVTFDICFNAIAPKNGELISLIINVEAQNDFYPGYPIIKRGIYYCSRMISAQNGTVFDKSHYEKIKKVYSIWICANPPKKRENTINRYSVQEENCVGAIKEQKEDYDLLTTVLICLGKTKDNDAKGILKLLDILLLAEMKADEKQRILGEEFGIPMTEVLEGKVENMCNLSDGVMQRGEERGRIEGKREERLASIKSLMEKLKLTVEQAMDALGIPESEQMQYKNMVGK